MNTDFSSRRVIPLKLALILLPGILTVIHMAWTPGIDRGGVLVGALGALEMLAVLTVLAAPALLTKSELAFGLPMMISFWAGQFLYVFATDDECHSNCTPDAEYTLLLWLTVGVGALLLVLIVRSLIRLGDRRRQTPAS